MFKLPRKIIDDITRYRESFQKFLSGELKDAFFKGIRVPWGSYSQRKGKHLMTRLRIPAGILTPEQLRAVGQAAKDFADGKVHITTRLDLQIHNVPWENPLKIVDYLVNYNLTSRGCGGNTVRGITSCYLSGICPLENIEVYQLVFGLTEYLLAIDDAYNLPRKFKIAFSGCRDDCGFTGVNDLGFIAVGKGFKVLCGGGMGAKSAVGKILHEEITPDEVGYVTKAVMNVFNKYGDRKNRHHNRLRFLIEDLGWEKFVELYQQEIVRTKEEEHIVLRIENGLPALPAVEGKLEIEPFGDLAYQAFLKYNVGKQKQEGYYYIKLRIPFGEISAEELISLSELSSSLPHLIFRTTPRQNLVITNVPAHKINFVYEKVKQILVDFIFPDTVLDVVSCKAASTCNLGICNAIALAPTIVEKLKTAELDLDKYRDVKININGCPNACGQHPVGTLSFAGMAKKVYGHTVPFYRVFVGGKVAAKNTKLAEEMGVVPARVVPDLVVEYFKGTPLPELVKKYAQVPAYEENRSYYVDWGQTADFSLEGIGQGECGAGVIDMIESDLNSAKQSLAKAKDKDFDLEEIKDALVYAARSLLVVKGI
ncbi:MAG: nitrite/sulfite reductase, partial [Candidatus Margulisiibacteriota bacterium]